MKLKFLLVPALVLSFIVSPFTLVQAMTEDELRARLDTIVVRLTEVANEISLDPSLTEDELLVLMTELVSISREVVEIQETLSPLKNPAFYQESVEDDAARDTVDDAGIKSVLLTYDSAGNAGNVVVERTSGPKVVRGYAITPAGDATYDDELDLIKKTALDDLATFLDVKRGELADILMLRSVHPLILKPGSIVYNSEQAMDVATRFGFQSIVNEISVWPGKDFGYVDFKSEFGEKMRLSLEKVGADYNARITYSIALVDIGHFELSLNDAEILEFTQPITERVPFAAALLNFDRKFVNFLTNNNARLVSLSTYGPDEYHPDRDCYYNSDKVAFSGYLKTLVSGTLAQMTPTVLDNVKYAAPVLTVGFDDSFSYPPLPTCENRVRFF